MKHSGAGGKPETVGRAGAAPAHAPGHVPPDPDYLNIIARHQATPGGLLPMLHDFQDRYGWIPQEAVPLMADALNLSRAEVHGVVSYYHHFRTQRPGRHVLQICRAESCLACGGQALWDTARQALGCDEHQTSADGAVTLEPVYCLGLCAASPALRVDAQVHARVDPAGLGRLIQALQGP